jgi:hypothetical protein
MRRTRLMLSAMTLLGLAMVSLCQLGFAQSNPLIGTSWKLNLDKSKYIAGPAPRSITMSITQDGQNVRDTIQVIDAQGNATTGVIMHVYDGQAHPATISLDYDATILTPVDSDTLIYSRLKAGKLVATGTFVVSPDGKTVTVTNTGIDRNGKPLKSIAVYDKQ